MTKKEEVFLIKMVPSSNGRIWGLQPQEGGSNPPGITKEIQYGDELVSTSLEALVLRLVEEATFKSSKHNKYKSKHFYEPCLGIKAQTLF